MIYLDNAATTKPSASAFERAKTYVLEKFYTRKIQKNTVFGYTVFFVSCYSVFRYIQNLFSIFVFFCNLLFLYPFFLHEILFNGIGIWRFSENDTFVVY